MNSTVQASVLQTECLINQKSKKSKSQGNYPRLLYWKNKQERTKRKDQSWRRLATVNKIAQKAGYTLPTYQEKRTIVELLQQHGEYSYLTGKKLGTRYLSTLDIDIRKEELAEKLTERLEKNVACLLNSLQVSYDKTKKGLHVDILTTEPLDNQQIYYQGWGKTWNIGSIQSLGKYVVGEDKDKAFIKNGKWYWKVKNNEEVKSQLAKFFFRLGNQAKPKEVDSRQLLVNETIKTVRYQAWDYNLNQAVMREYSLIVEKPQKKPQQQLLYSVKKQTIQAKILSKEKVLKLEDMWKVFYLDWKTQTTGYFLVNNYQKSYALPNLNIGSVRNMVLIQGFKHSFLSRIIGKIPIWKS
jgi:hypothetical protein